MINTNLDETLTETISEATLLAALEVEQYLEATTCRESILTAILSTSNLGPEIGTELQMKTFVSTYYLAANPHIDEVTAGTLVSITVDVLSSSPSQVIARRLAQNPSLSQDNYLLLLICLSGDTELKQNLALNPSVGYRVLSTLLLEEPDIAEMAMSNPNCSVHLRKDAGFGVKGLYEAQLADNICLIAASTSPEEFSPLVPLLNFDQETLDTAFAANPNTPASFREVLMERGGTASWIIINKMHENYYTQ